MGRRPPARAAAILAGLGFDATDFLDEKMRIFEGTRERASLSIKGMPKELETVFIESLNLDIDQLSDAAAKRQQKLRDKLEELGGHTKGKGPEAHDPEARKLTA